MGLNTFFNRVESTRRAGGQSRKQALVEQIGYDKYGQRTFIEFGNGVRTDYSYDPHRRWLEVTLPPKSSTSS